MQIIYESLFSTKTSKLSLEFLFSTETRVWAINIPCIRSLYLCTRILFSFTKTLFCIHIDFIHADTFFVYTDTHFFLFGTYKLEVPLIQMLIIRLVPQWDTTKHDEDMALVIGRFKLTPVLMLILVPTQLFGFDQSKTKPMKKFQLDNY